jgi:arylsulfatase A-like enzyme
MPYNVIFISIGTMRSDRLGCYGYDHATSPHMDAAAGQGALFAQAVAPHIPTNPRTARSIRACMPSPIRLPSMPAPPSSIAGFRCTSSAEGNFYFEHQGLYDGVIRIAMILRLPGIIGPVRRIDTAVAGYDLTLSILELVDIASAYGLPYDLTGCSLWPLIEGGHRGTMRRTCPPTRR